MGLVMACVKLFTAWIMQSQASRHKLEPIGSVAFEPQQRRGNGAWWAVGLGKDARSRFNSKCPTALFSPLSCRELVPKPADSPKPSPSTTYLQLKLRTVRGARSLFLSPLRFLLLCGTTRLNSHFMTQALNFVEDNRLSHGAEELKVMHCSASLAEFLEFVSSVILLRY